MEVDGTDEGRVRPEAASSVAAGSVARQARREERERSRREVDGEG